MVGSWWRADTDLAELQPLGRHPKRSVLIFRRPPRFALASSEGLAVGALFADLDLRVVDNGRRRQFARSADSALSRESLEVIGGHGRAK